MGLSFTHEMRIRILPALVAPASGGLSFDIAASAGAMFRAARFISFARWRKMLLLCWTP